MSPEILLSLIAGLTTLYFAAAAIRVALSRRPCFLSSRSLFLPILPPVMIMVGFGLWKMIIIPSYLSDSAFYGAMAVIFIACATVLWLRGGWCYVFGVSEDEMLGAIRRALKKNFVMFEEIPPDSGPDADAAVIFALNAFEKDFGGVRAGDATQIRLRAAVYAGQETAQIGLVPGDAAMHNALMASIREEFEGAEQKRSVPGFLILICLLSALAVYWIYSQVGSIDAELYIQRGRTYIEISNPEAAVNTFNRAERLDPENPEVFRWRGLANQKAGNSQKALDDWEKALILNPSSPEILAHIASVLIEPGPMQDRERAVRAAEKAAQMAPESVFCLDVLASVMAGIGDFQGAVQIQEKVVKILRDKNAAKKLMKEVNERLEAYKAGRV